MDKKTLRKALLQLRQSRSWSREQDLIGKHLRNYFRCKRYRCVGLYWPIKNEIDVRDVLRELQVDGFVDRLALPKIIGNEMRFVCWDRETELSVNALRVAEPISEEEVSPELLLVPCVAMDLQGHRLGYGGGYFDRYLEKFPETETIGIIAHDFLLEEIPTQSHDCVLDAWITEFGWKKDANRTVDVLIKR